MCGHGKGERNRRVFVFLRSARRRRTEDTSKTRFFDHFLGRFQYTIIVIIFLHGPSVSILDLINTSRVPAKVVSSYFVYTLRPFTAVNAQTRTYEQYTSPLGEFIFPSQFYRRKSSRPSTFDIFIFEIPTSYPHTHTRARARNNNTLIKYVDVVSTK